MGKILYHITKRANLLSVMFVGLRLDYCGKKGLTNNHIWNPKRIFLTDDPHLPIRQGMVTAKNSTLWCLLAVNCDGLDIQQHVETCYEITKPITNEFVVYTNIEPTRLQLLEIESIMKE